MLSAKTEWIALGYSVPANPSKARVYVWRRLRAIKAQALRPGVALLPNTKENLAAFELLAKKIRGFSGEAVLIEMNFVDSAEHQEMYNRFARADEADLRNTLAECSALLEEINKTSDPQLQEILKKDLSRKLNQLPKTTSSSFKDQADELEQAMGTLFDTLRSLPAEFAAMLRFGR